MRKLLLFFLLFFLPVFLLKAEDREVLKNPKILENVYPFRIWTTQTYQPLKTQLIEDIKKAKEEILLYSFTFSDPDIIKAINEQAKAGVSCVVVLDAVQNKKTVKLFDAKVDLVKRKGAGLMHKKIWVFDRKKVWIGSANLTKEALFSQGNLMIEIFSPELAEEISRDTKLVVPKGPMPSLGPHKVTMEEKEMDLFHMPSSDAFSYVIEKMRSAKKTIQIAMYIWTHPDLRQEAIRAYRRGVKVEVLLDKSSEKMNRETAYILKRTGISVRFSQNVTLLHYKMLFIDNNFLVTGSPNWTKAAFLNNDEVMVGFAVDLKERGRLESLWKRIWTEGKSYGGS